MGKKLKKIASFRHWIRVGLTLVLLAVSLPFGQVKAVQSANDYIYLVREIELADLGVNSLGGLAYSSPADALVVLQGQPVRNNRLVTSIDRNKNVLGTSELSGQPGGPLQMAFDKRFNSLFTLNPATQGLAGVQANPNGSLPPAAGVSVQYSLQALGIPQIQGMDFDPASGQLFLLDPSGKRLVIVTPDQAGNYDAQSAMQANRVQRIDLKGIVDTHLVGLAFHPGLGHLFTIGKDGTVIYELTTSGDLVTTRDVTSFGIKSPQGIVVAPSGDDTDDPSIQSLYIADVSRNIIVEASITAPVVMALPAASPISLVNTILTSNWKPPSPDSSGIDYNPFTNQLVVSDSEVDEMPIFTGVNVYLSTLDGNLQSTCSTMSYTHEPSGLSVNTDNGNIFISDDGQQRLHQISLGADGRYCTGDDKVTTADTSTYGATDPEGVEYGNGKIFIAGGKNAEVYVISPGANKVYDGAPPKGDDVVVTHFDTSVMGLRDPEGIGFNPTRGSLFVVSRADNIMVETSQTGTVLRVFNIGFTNINKPSGVGLGPGSKDSSALNVYVTQRGVDNNTDPKENDGKVFELNIGDSNGSQPPPTPTDTPTPGPTPSPSDVIFADGFESGDLTAWSVSTTGGGDLSASPNAALVGNVGMQAVINDNVSLFVTDISPNAEPTYNARFYFDPHSISMVSGDTHDIFYGISGASRVVLRIQFRFSSGAYQLRASLIDDSSIWSNTGWVTISDSPHPVEVDWRAATAAGSNDGGLTFWIDGVQKGSLTGINNPSARIDEIRLGAVLGIDPGTRGTYYMDAFESRRQTTIGP